jgi:16S rRNA processing protein RimM
VPVRSRAGSDPGAADVPDRLVVGRVGRPHGVRGEVSVEVLSDAPDRFTAGVEFLPGDPPGAAPHPLRVETARSHHGRQLVRFAGVADRDGAERLRGVVLTIAAEHARPLGPDEYWPHQLVGLDVVDHAGTVRGTVGAVTQGAAHDLLEVRLVAGGTVLVPAVAALVTVSLDAGRITVADVPGLLGED